MGGSTELRLGELTIFVCVAGGKHAVSVAVVMRKRREQIPELNAQNARTSR